VSEIAKHSARSLARRPLQYVWVEHYLVDDGVAFDRAFSQLGFRNLLLALPTRPGHPKQRLAKNPHNLRFEWARSGDQEGLLAIVVSEDEFDQKTGQPSLFVAKWIQNPGIANGSLTYETVADQADLVIVSGHGADGLFMAPGLKGHTELGEALREGEIPVGPRPKYFIFAACHLANKSNMPMWRYLFEREAYALRGIFGYEEKCPDGPAAPAVMRRFAELLKRNPTRAMVDLWGEANRGLQWGALQLVDARNDSLQQWEDAALPHATSANGINYFTAKKPQGELFVEKPETYELRWSVEDASGREFEVNRSNNGKSRLNVGLFPGRRGAIILRIHDPASWLRSGQKVKILVYYFRPTKTEIEIDKLLDLDGGIATHESSSIRATLSRGANPQRANSILSPFDKYYDGIDLAVLKDVPPNAAGGRIQEIRIPFKVKGEALHRYKADTADDKPTHGRFVLGLVPPGAGSLDWDSFPYPSVHGVWLREP